MKPLLILCALALLGGLALADIAPDNSGAWLFRIDGVLNAPASSSTTGSSGAQQPQYSVDSDHPLVNVVSVKDIALGTDMKAVEVDLNAKDAKKLAKISQTKNILLAFVSGDEKVIILSVMAAPITDGVLVFSDAHHSGPMAAYLRQAFHVKPGTNQLAVPPVQVNSTAAPKSN